MEMKLNDFKKPFKESEIEWRVSQAGTSNGKIWARVLPYVTNRAIMDRLDDVCGIEGWENEYKPAPVSGVLCGIRIHLWENKTLTKWDGADNTKIEGTKGGLSDSMKRAAVQWGIGRYLYALDTIFFAVIKTDGKFYQAKDKNGKYESFRWDAPKLPEWAVQNV